MTTGRNSGSNRTFLKTVKTSLTNKGSMTNDFSSVDCNGDIIRVLVERFNPLTTNVPHHLETNHLISNANQLTGFYMMGNISR